MSDHARLPVKRIADCTLGKMVQTGQRGPHDVFAPYLRAAHVQPSGRLIELDEQPMWFSPAELDGLDLRSGDVVVVEGGAGYGRSAVLTRPLPGWGFQNSIIRVRPRRGRADGRFIDYALQAALRSGEIENLCNTATIPHFTAEKVANLRIPAPAQAAQQAIADFLDDQTSRIDTLIGKQTQLIDTLRERRAVVEAQVLHTAAPIEKLAWRAIVSSGDAREGSLVSRDVTDQWRVKVIGGNGVMGYTDSSNVEKQTIAVGRVGALCGNVHLVTGPAWITDNALRVDVLSSFDLEYLSLVLRARKLNAMSRSTAQPLITGAQVSALRIPCPSPTEQRALVASISRQTAQIDALISKAEEFIGLARERRAALITAAVTGQIDVRTAGRAATVGA